MNLTGGWGNSPKVFEFAKLEARIAEIEDLQKGSDFWKDQRLAQELSRELADIKPGVEFIISSQTRLNEAAELNQLAGQENDEALKKDVAAELQSIDSALGQRENELQFDGPHDRSDAILSIQSGAGGTDAQDWAQMLERMYVRLAERRGWRVEVLDRALGEEAGIKRSTFQVSGKMAYGLLRGEGGVHRLVRLSPFNADNLRQTSFARVEVLPKLADREAPEIDVKDLKIDTFRASGAGGQHVNKTSSAVRITHIPTGIVSQCQNQRSQAQNKAHAMTVLQAKLQIMAEEQSAQEIKEIRGETKAPAWGNQIRSYTIHPYTLVKDHRTKHENSDVHAVLDGNLTGFVPEI